jgi:hypothetical protein
MHPSHQEKPHGHSIPLNLVRLQALGEGNAKAAIIPASRGRAPLLEALRTGFGDGGGENFEFRNSCPVGLRIGDR